MSLQLAAQHLSNQGRGNDSTLVHMSPREVKSLNALAMAHGGQLSINPQTGLPEAGFLSSILPMVAGAALVASGVGAPMAAMMVGGGTAVLTGSLEKGLMAGLGAYGGANMGQGLLASGTDAAVAAAPEVAAAQQNAAIQMEKFYNPTSQVLDKGGMEAIQKASMDASAAQTAARTAAAPDFMSKIKAMGSGISSLGQEGGLSSLYQNLGGSPMSLLKSVGSAAAPAIGEAMTPKKQEEEKADADMGQRYAFSMNPTGGQKPQQVQPGQDPLSNTQSPTTTPFPFDSSKNPFDSSEKRYFSPSYRKITAEEAKELYGYAEGGEVDKAEPKETPALQMFKQMQAQRAAQPQTPQYASTPATGGSPAANAPAPTTVEGLYRTYLDRAPEKGGLDFWNKHFGPDVDAGEIERFKMGAAPELAANKRLAEQTGGGLAHEYGEYLRQARGEPNQLQAPTAPPPTSTQLADLAPTPTTTNSDSEMLYNPATQKYTKNPNFAGAAADDPLSPENLANNFYANPYAGQSGRRLYGAAGGLMAAYAGGGMPTDPSSIGANEHYPHAHTPMNRFSTPTQIPIGEDIVSSGGARIDLSTGEERLAAGGISHLGDYSDGGRLLRGPGDGVSDSIPAMIGKRQPARLADGEFVVPARIVSELGNGSTEAGARKLYAMMDRIQKARRKTVGKGKVAKNSRSEKYLPA